ncbi:riboflavin biosynthesis protein RibF [Lentilactobacillus sp. SPB1-3]|uniref:Riboflavin biosynthesis protein RibF n=1 Tax=Lentilactobacillus terminaliae TaxID=3003483 RepID=A0ACD5DCR9_9LACO|nr:riboflavin biosynthesis protein RibF [Lentilactobacillus sp. SPB1-3]MCZ0977302.1 riboflavin biosynthesis protein RibF [Lentilactobacillus sp. SPB1-3]
MEIVKLHYPLADNVGSKEKIVLAMGFFDGVHLGHQDVINKAKQIAEKSGAKLAVLTYDHHPAIVYKQLNDHEKRYLTMYEEKMRIFESLGVDRVYYTNYTYAFQAQSEQEFVDNFIKRFNAITVVAGFDHTYGGTDTADMKHLPDYSDGKFNVVTADPIEFEGEKVSSTRIRKALDDCDVNLTTHLLGRPFRSQGYVVHGREVGRLLGYPTANVEHSELQWLPNVGIYVVRVQVGDQQHIAMASVGHNVTFSDKLPMTIEINILDFNQNIYGETITVDWLDYIRGEVKFATTEQLTKQLYEDELYTRDYLKRHPEIISTH